MRARARQPHPRLRQKSAMSHECAYGARCLEPEAAVVPCSNLRWSREMHLLCAKELGGEGRCEGCSASRTVPPPERLDAAPLVEEERAGTRGSVEERSGGGEGVASDDSAPSADVLAGAGEERDQAAAEHAHAGARRRRRNAQLAEPAEPAAPAEGLPAMPRRTFAQKFRTSWFHPRSLPPFDIACAPASLYKKAWFLPNSTTLWMRT